MRSLIFLVLALASQFCFAQEEAELRIGDTLFFSDCEGANYQYMDLYVKTRFEKDSISLDSIEGWAFYNEFFTTGDFDVQRLPCSYSGRYGIIKHIMSIEDELGAWHNVIYAMIVDGSSVAYLIEDAFIEGEVLFAPKQ